MPLFSQWVNPIYKAGAHATGPAIGARAVTPNDGADLPFSPARRLYVGTGGNVSVVYEPGSTAVTYVNVPSGFVFGGFITRVNATGTTATNIIAEY
jgi:hypothetical protein